MTGKEEKKTKDCEETNRQINKLLDDTIKSLHTAFYHPDVLRGRGDALKGKPLPKKANSRYRNGYEMGCSDMLRYQNRIRELKQEIPKLRKELAELRKLIGKKR
jgi:hypothetical protein